VYTRDWIETGLRRSTWDVSEAAALELLDEFVRSGLQGYETRRNRADQPSTSRLGPYLHFGQLSPRAMLARLERSGCRETSKTFWRRLAWRDLAYWQLHHFPSMAAEAIRPQHRQRTWQGNPALLRAWQRGMTGGKGRVEELG